MPDSNNKLSKNLRIAVLLVGLVLLVLNLFSVNYDQLLSRENLGAGLRFLSNIFIIVAMVVSLKYTARKKGNN